MRSQQFRKNHLFLFIVFPRHPKFQRCIKTNLQVSLPNHMIQQRLSYHVIQLDSDSWSFRVPRPENVRIICVALVASGGACLSAPTRLKKPGDLRLCWAISKWNPTGNHFFPLHKIMDFFHDIQLFFIFSIENPHVSWEIIWDLGLWKIDGSCVGTKSHHWNHCWSIFISFYHPHHHH